MNKGTELTMNCHVVEELTVFGPKGDVIIADSYTDWIVTRYSENHLSLIKSYWGADRPEVILWGCGTSFGFAPRSATLWGR